MREYDFDPDACGHAQEQVRKFHKTFRLPAPNEVNLTDFNLNRLRCDLILEEYQEFITELLRQNPDPERVAKELADLAYVVYGAAIALGIDLDACITRVHHSNMSKLDDTGQPLFRMDGKVMKGPNYEPPNLKPVLGL